MSNVISGIKEAIRILRREPPVTPGEFDVKELPGLLGKDDPVILDIGSNDGGQTLQFLSLFRAARVYAFEPDPRAAETFRARVTDARAKLFRLAISDEDGTARFYASGGAPSSEWREARPAGWDLSGSIRKPTGHRELHPWCTFDAALEVETKRLDTWCREEGVGEIDFIWADVQGAEESLIRGGREALSRTRYFYTEYSDHELYEGQIGLREILRLLPDFKVLYRFPGDMLLKNRRWD